MSDLNGDRPALKKLLFKCPDCGEEWHKWVPVDEKKVRRFCPNTAGTHERQLVTPYRTEQKLTRDRQVRKTVIRPYW